MSETFKAISRRVASETALWIIPAAGFLVFYVRRHEGPLNAVGPHLQLVSMLFVANLVARFIVWRWAGGRIASAAVTVIFAGCLGALYLFYLSNWIALENWGRIISTALIRTYASQASALTETLGLQPLVVAVTLVVILGGIMAAVHQNLTRRDWIRAFALRAQRPFVATVSTISLAAIGISFWHWVEFTQASSGEPVLQTFRPLEGLRSLGSHVSRVSWRVDIDEFHARARLGSESAKGSPNVIIVVIDALRADRLGVNGYGRGTTPYLDELVRSSGGASVQHAYAVCAESACGLMAIAASRNVHRLPAQPITLQEVLRRQGYTVHMILSGDHTNFYGLRSNYGELDSYYDGSMTERYMNDDALIIDRLRSMEAFDDRPAFIQFHLMSAHALSRRHDAGSPFQPYRSYLLDKLGGLGSEVKAGPDPRHVNYYDNGVFAADRWLEALVAELRARGLLDNAVMVVTADHGELVGEKGEFSHARTVREEVLRVPLVFMTFKRGTREPVRLQAVASQIDIAPTILASLGIAAPTTWTGIPLQIRSTENEIRPRSLLFRQGMEYGLIDTRNAGRLWKFQVDARTGREQLYELLSDPAAAKDLIGDVDAKRKREWRSELLELRSHSAEQGSPTR